MDKLVSIVMPTYNVGAYVSDTIKSIIAQTYTNWELLIVDDCSTDNTVDIINSFSDSRIHLFSNETNSGAAISRNYALRQATGKWVAFLDGDDIWDSRKLEKQIKFMEDNGYGFTFTDYRICLNGKWLPYECYGPDHVNKIKMYNYCYFSTITVMYDRERVGLVQIENLRKNNDYAMWLQIIEKCDAYRLPECLSYYIKHDESISSGNKLKLIKWHYRLFRIGLKKDPVTSVVLTGNNLVHGVIKKIRYVRHVEGEPVLVPETVEKEEVNV